MALLEVSYDKYHSLSQSLCGLLMILDFKFAVNSGNAHRIDELNLLGVKTVNKLT